MIAMVRVTGFAPVWGHGDYPRLARQVPSLLCLLIPPNPRSAPTRSRCGVTREALHGLSPRHPRSSASERPAQGVIANPPSGDLCQSLFHGPQGFVDLRLCLPESALIRSIVRINVLRLKPKAFQASVDQRRTAANAFRRRCLKRRHYEFDASSAVRAGDNQGQQPLSPRQNVRTLSGIHIHVRNLREIVINARFPAFFGWRSAHVRAVNRPHNWADFIWGIGEKDAAPIFKPDLGTSHSATQSTSLCLHVPSAEVQIEYMESSG